MTPRWEQRFDNLRSMLARLEETVRLGRQRPLTDLEQAGLVQQFELSWELGWKTIRDFLSDGGSPVPTPTAANVIRAAFEMGLIEDGDAWIAAMKARNTMAHVYDPAAFEAIGDAIAVRFAPLLNLLVARLELERARR